MALSADQPFLGLAEVLPSFEGERLLVRPAEYEEWAALRELRFSPDVLRFDHPDRPLPSVEEERAWWLREVAGGTHLLWAIVRRDQPPLGFLSLFDRDPGSGECETGIEILRREDHGRGYATEAYRLVLPWIRARPGLRSVRALTNPDHRAAVALYEKLGFVREGLVPDGPISWLRLGDRWA